MKRSVAKLILMVTTTALVLSGCFGAGITPEVDGSGEPVGPDFSTVGIRTIAEGSAGDLLLSNWNEQEQPHQAYSDTIDALWQIENMIAIIQEWTPNVPSSYSYPEESPSYDVTWTESGGVYTWDLFDGEVTYTVEISDSGSDFTVKVFFDETTLLDGSFAYDGNTGSGTIDDGLVTINYNWSPSLVPAYDLEINITITDMQQSVTTMTIDTTADGSAGEYDGTEGGVPYGPISWPQTPG